MSRTPDEVKSQAQERFSRFAQGYVASESHASGTDLDRLIELAQPQPEWVALDVATGGGHTALKFAPHVARVVAADLAPEMLAAAQAFITGKGVTNVEFVPADAENLPFDSASFDLVTCRIAPHHFPDVYAFVRQCQRVLKPGGLLLVQDHLLPDHKNAARYIEAFERLRDPSHHHAYSEIEWRGLFLDAQLTVEHTEIVRKPARLVEWAERQGCAPETIAHLQIMLAQAPQAVADWLHPNCAGSPDAGFDHVHLIILGKKPEN